MGKVLAIDFGLKRCGLAISDEARFFAFGLKTIDSKDLSVTLDELVEREKLSDIVIGLPKRLNDEDTHITENVRILKEVLEKKYPLISIHLEDERFTSSMASNAIHMAGASKKQKKDKGLVDKVSATIILQSFLDNK